MKAEHPPLTEQQIEELERRLRGYRAIGFTSQSIPLHTLAALLAERERLREALVLARRAMIVSVTGISDGLTIQDIRQWIKRADEALAGEVNDD